MSISHTMSMEQKKLDERSAADPIVTGKVRNERLERLSVDTGFGEIAYLEAGQGPPAVFVHGVFLNADLWRHQLEGLADVRRCLALDLLAHGASASGGAGLTIGDQADMVVDFLDALGTRLRSIWWATTAEAPSPSSSPSEFPTGSEH